MTCNHEIRKILGTIFAVLTTVTVLAVPICDAAEKTKINAAQFTTDGQLLRPKDIEQWIFLGASVGHGYPEGKPPVFSLGDPGSIQVVQMEPAAYRYLMENGKTADGTMLALSFYNTQEKPLPAVDGLVQGDLASFEIHILDREQYAENRAFYLFQNGSDTAAMIPEGNSCVACHIKDAAFEGTFVQFYPRLRERLLNRVVAEARSE